jgi:hypothetical protein
MEEAALNKIEQESKPQQDPYYNDIARQIALEIEMEEAETRAAEELLKVEVSPV